MHVFFLYNVGTMLEINNISKEFFGKKVVNDVSFRVSSGEVVGFLGPNGAGKTTTMRMIATLLEAESGTITFNDKNIRDNPMYIRERLGYMPENNPLYEGMLVSEYLEYVADLKGLRKIDKTQAIKRAVGEVEIEDVYHKPIIELSKGYKQRVGLAQAIMHKPDLLILDEPTEGLDPNQRVSIRNLIKNLGKNHTVIISTHVLQEVTATCSRIIIINDGKIVADGKTEDLIAGAQGKRTIHLEAEGVSVDALMTLKGVENVKEKTTGQKTFFDISVAGDLDIRADIFDTVKGCGGRIWELRQERGSLEDVFRELTKESES